MKYLIFLLFLLPFSAQSQTLQSADDVSIVPGGPMYSDCIFYFRPTILENGDVEIQIRAIPAPPSPGVQALIGEATIRVDGATFDAGYTGSGETTDRAKFWDSCLDYLLDYLTAQNPGKTITK